MDKMMNWEFSPDGKPVVQGLTLAQTAEFGPHVAVRLEWEGPVEAQEQSTGSVQLVLRREAAFALAQELTRMSGMTTPEEPKGTA